MHIQFELILKLQNALWGIDKMNILLSPRQVLHFQITNYNVNKIFIEN